MNYNEAVDYIFHLRKFGVETGCQRAQRALKKLGNPEEQLNIIHVAGTNGKGSVCAFLTNLLRGRGYSVGMFTSPHLVKVNERIQLDGVMITDEEFMHYFHQVEKVSKELVQEGFDGLAFFDFVFVMAVLFYADRHPDYVVLETGLGGRTDATAAIQNKVLSVITSISLDHTEILGDTVEKIAKEKAGIIVPKTPVVFWKTSESVERILAEEAKVCQSDWYAVDEKSYKIHKIGRNNIDFSIGNEYYRHNAFSISFAGIYQVMNATLALNALCVLLGKEKSSVDYEDQQETQMRRKDMQSIYTTHWAGRMEEVRPRVYLDGAHNPDGIARFLESAKQMKNSMLEECPIAKMVLLFGAVCEKDYEQMIKEVCEAGCFDSYVITMIHNQRALKTEVMEAVFRKYTDCAIFVEEDNNKAYQKAMGLLGEQDVLICAGSLYLVGAIKELIGE